MAENRKESEWGEVKIVFTFDGKHYKTVALKNGEEHCEKCAFDECRQCEYSPAIPDCDGDKREDGLNVYFVQLKTNFDRITESPEELAEKVVYLVTDKYDDGTEWHSVLVNGGWRTREEAVAETIKWLNKEEEK